MPKLYTPIPQDAVYILNQLNQNGHEAYIVGGCVRDSILGRTPQDWDITTSALPAEIKAIFPHTFDTGIKHGTVTVVLHHENYEVTTYRIDGEYTDCRHPNAVSFTKRLTEDLLRRDFTMNAIAYHPKDGFRDPFHGQTDIAAGIIRGVGAPEKRFQEDALRMLRCVRFAAQLGFSIEPETRSALCANTALIQKISVERVREELQKLFLAPFTEKIPLLWESGLLAQIDATLSANLSAHRQTLLAALSLCPEDMLLRWCIVLQYAPKTARDFLIRMKFDTHSLRRICLLLAELPDDLPTTPYPLRKKLSTIGQEATEQLLLLQGILRPDSPHAETKAALEKILASGDCLSLKTLALTGQDLMALGVPHGKILGNILAELLDAVLQAPEKNTKESLTTLALALLEQKDKGGIN